MSARKPSTFWVVFYRATRHRKWRPAFTDKSRSVANRFFQEQVDNGPPGGHRLQRFEVKE